MHHGPEPEELVGRPALMAAIVGSMPTAAVATTTARGGVRCRELAWRFGSAARLFAGEFPDAPPLVF